MYFVFVSAQEPKPKHLLVFQHIPLFVKNPDEEDDYFNLQRAVRQNLMDRFKRAGKIIRALFLQEDSVEWSLCEVVFTCLNIS